MSNLITESYATVGQIAEFLRVQSWQVQRLFKRGILPEPPRFGGRRMVPKETIPEIVAALQERGWFPPREIDPSEMVGRSTSGEHRKTSSESRQT